MRLFFCELRKLWNWRITSAIFAFSIVFFNLFLWNKITDVRTDISGDDVNSMMDFAMSVELLEKYGTVIDRDEIINGFGLDAKIQALFDYADTIIAADEDGVFAKYGIKSYTEYEEYPIENIEWEDLERIVFNRDAYFRDLGLQLSMLRNMKQRYDANDMSHNSHISDSAFVYARELEAREDRSVMPYYLPFELSRYAMMVTILCVVCTVFLVSPFITADRTRRIYQLQYSSAYGRKIFGTQFTAVIVSAFVMSLAITVICSAAYATLNTQIFADASIVSFWGMSFFMYGITYGQYALLLAAMPVILSTAVACAGFLLSRYSDTYVKLLTKALPLALVGILVGVAAVRVALTNENTVFVLFGSSLPAPEIWVSILLMAAGITAAAVIVKKEKRIDVM